ncbi:MAG: hypothetical protein ACOYBM_03375 [Dethiobacteria bacterium]|jgi:hypothetical protein
MACPLRGSALRVKIIFLFLFFFLFSTTAAAWASSPPGFASKAVERRVTMLVLDRLTLEEIQEFAGPNLKKVISAGAIALMNVNTAGRPERGGGYLTIGAGSRGRGAQQAGVALNTQEHYEKTAAEELYFLHLGKEAGDSAVIFPFLPDLQMENRQLSYPLFPGALGELLQEAGLKNAVLGNADTDELRRQAVLIAMNREGRVDYGDVSTELLTKDPAFPYGIHTDAEKMWRQYKTLPADSCFIVVEWGDTTRLDLYRRNLSASSAEKILAEIFVNLDRFIGCLYPTLGDEHLLIIAVPSSAQQLQGSGKQLTPVIFTGGGIGPGLAWSATTRHAGVVTNLDLPATVLSFFELTIPPYFFGSPVCGYQAESPLSFLLAKEKLIAGVYEQRPFILRAYILLEIFVIIGSVAALLFNYRPARCLRYLLVGIIVVPIVLLILPLFPLYPYPHALLTSFVLLLFSAAVVYLLFRIETANRFRLIFTITGLLTATVIIFDLLLGGELLRTSFLGHDAIGGARFYGIGNEYMGVFVGATILGTTALFTLCSSHLNISFREWKERLLIIIIFASIYLFVVFLFASPRFGANFGGTVAAFVAFATTIFVLLQLPFTLRLLVRLGLPLLFFLFLLLLLLNFLLPGEASHLGRAWTLISSNGSGELFNIIERKWQMNMKLVRYSIWSRILLLLLPLQALFLKHPISLILRVREKEPFLFAGFTGNLAGSITAFFVNDSGVVAAATLLLYGAVPMLLLIFEENFSTGLNLTPLKKE